MFDELKKNLRTIYKVLLLEEKYKKILFFLSTLTIIFLETISLSMLLPFIDILFSLITNSSLSFNFSEKILNYFIYFNTTEIIVYLSIFLILIFVFKNFFIIGLNYFNLNFQFNITNKLTNNLLKIFLHKDYEELQKFDSGQILRNIVAEPKIIVSYFSAIIIFIVESTLLVFLLILLLISQPVGITSILLLIIIALLIIKISLKKLKKWGESRFKASASANKYLILPFTNNVEIKLLGLENLFFKLFAKENIKILRTTMNLTFIQIVNRYLIEIIFITSILSSLIFAIIFYQGNFANILTSISILTVIALRAIPSINKIINSTQSISFLSKNMKNVELMLKGNFKFEINKSFSKKYKKFKSLLIKNVNFKYQNNNFNSLKNISFNLNRGDKILIYGASGEGKSTFLKTIAGLLNPQEGTFFLNDNKIKIYKYDWNRNLSYVPQKSIVLDGSIINNITLTYDNDEVNFDKVNELIKICQLSELIERQEKKLHSKLTEGATNFSTGQLQRICLARHLYFSPDILILDEATNAMDKKNEELIIQKMLDDKELTLIMTTHSKNLMSKFEKKYQFIDGKLFKE